MRVYNQQIVDFLRKISIQAKEILSDELNLKVKNTRFLYNHYLYPLNIVCFEHPTKLGEFDPSNYNISINRFFIDKDPALLKDVLRHELAHYFAFIKYGAESLGHGPLFRQVCAEAGWSDEVSSAKMNMGEIKQIEHQNKYKDKVKKLLSLASNSNEHESNLATAKANEIMLKYGIDQIGKNEEDICVLEVLTFKRRNNKHIAIYDILSDFYVHPVFSQSNFSHSIEVTGSRCSVELAHYVADYLDLELDYLWKKVKFENKLSGIRAKNSFFKGISKGYIRKIDETRSTILADNPTALIKIKKDLIEKTQIAYKRLSSTSSQSKTETSSFNLGVKAGKNLTIKKGIKSTSSQVFLLGK